MLSSTVTFFATAMGSDHQHHVTPRVRHPKFVSANQRQANHFTTHSVPSINLDSYIHSLVYFVLTD